MAVKKTFIAKSDRLSLQKQQRMLAALDGYAKTPIGSQTKAQRELHELRRARRQGGRKTRFE